MGGGRKREGEREERQVDRQRDGAGGEGRGCSRQRDGWVSLLWFNAIETARVISSVSFPGGGNRSTRRKPPTHGK